jgi:Uncharacterized protein conserved in bacteria
MLVLNTNVKGLIITIILAIGMISVRTSYIYNSVNKNNFNNETSEIQYVAQSNNSKDKNEIKENKATPPQSKEQQVNSQIDTNQAKSKEKPGSNQLSRGGSISNELDITLTFYTSLPEENGGFNGINCSGKKLTSGTVANNVLPLGTEIYTKEFGTLTVSDRGGDNFNTINRLDVYIPREDGESNQDYLSRVNNMGIVKVKGYIIRH